ncbi:MAG: hypothetical protein DRN00_00920 [Thermoplasmata archaeon]|nr:MAG: hypothetical protein DRN00_00920 [Thermoplasmata archaeon]
MRWKLLAGIVAMLLVATMPAGVMGAGEISRDTKNLSCTILLEKPRIEDKGKYVLVDLKGSTDEETAFYMETGKPIIPVVAKTFFFPIGTKINRVNVNIERKCYTLEKKIEPSPKPVVLLPNVPVEPEAKPDPSVYNSDSLYPEKPYKIRYGAGIKDGEHVLIVNIKCYAQYSPARDIIYIPERVDISIDYSLPEKPLFSGGGADLLIITHEKFKPYLQPLVEHKNKLGIRTLIKTVQEIYEEYPIGCMGTKRIVKDKNETEIPIPRDKPEQIKYAIKDAIERYGIKYVLIFGGRKGQTLDWWVPDRKSLNVAESPAEFHCDPGYSCDLYFADIYRTTKSGRLYFDDWDTNENGIVDDWFYMAEDWDNPDYYPDVYVGRIPVRTEWEAKIAVDKIIKYENDGGAWFKKAVMVSGDTFPPARGASKPVYEGERECDVAAGYLEKAGFEVEKLYTSKGNFNSYEDVMRAIGNGVGFVYTAGHGNPALWGNFLPMARTEDEFVLGHTVFDIWRYSNDHYAFIVIGGCHNSQFNISGQYFIDYLITGNMSKHVRLSEHYPYCDGYWWLLDRDGGAIGSIGNTGLGYGYIDEHSTEGLGGWLEPRFFHAYAIQGKHRAGEAWAQAITDYINIIGGVWSDQVDRKTIEELVLLGDPSIKLGGYASSKDVPGSEESKEGRHATLQAEKPVWKAGTTWIFNVSNLDLTLNNVEGRYIDLHVKTGDLQMEVSKVEEHYYELFFTMTNLTVSLSIDFDPMVKGLSPIKIKLPQLEEINLSGRIWVDKETMGIISISLDITTPLYLTKLPLEEYNISIPAWIAEIVDSTYPLVLNAQVDIDFDRPYTLVKFPLSAGDCWGLKAATVSIELEGSIESLWLRVLYTLNKVAKLFGFRLIAPEYEKLLPVIKIAGVKMSFNLPEIFGRAYADISTFECEEIENVTVEAGSFSAYKIFSVRHIGEYWYSPEAKMFVMAKGNFNGLCPVVKDFVLELKEMRGV